MKLGGTAEVYFTPVLLIDRVGVFFRLLSVHKEREELL